MNDIWIASAVSILQEQLYDSIAVLSQLRNTLRKLDLLYRKENDVE
jgi:hypothetical protein